MEQAAAEESPQEPCAGETFLDPADPAAWPAAAPIVARARRWWTRHPMIRWLETKEHVARCTPLPIEPDRLCDTLEARRRMPPACARPVRDRTDEELPEDIRDRIVEDLMPQFTLRNLERVTREVYEDEPLEWKHVGGVGCQLGLLDVRPGRLERVELRFAEIWSVAFQARIREMLRRLLHEEPWHLRFGREIRDTLQRPLWHYFPEGVHPDDIGPMESGPELIRPRDQWVEAPPGEPPFERPPLPGEVGR